MPELLRYRHIRKRKDGSICGHEWTPSFEKPSCCPRCKMYLDWNHPETCIEIIKSENPK